jgi:hypothetical protein
MCNERLKTRGSPLRGDGRGAPQMCRPFPRGSPGACWGVGFQGAIGGSRMPASYSNLLADTAANTGPTWYSHTTPERQSLGGSTAIGRGFMTQ